MPRIVSRVLEVSYFSNHVIPKKDKDIMTNQNLNPILIDRDIAPP